MNMRQGVTILYGLLAIVSGIWRHLQTGDSPQAVWFGIVTGALALLGAGLLSLRNRVAGYLLIGVSLGFVGYWYLQRMLSGHPDGTSVRVIMILVIWAIEIGALVWRRRSP